MSAKLRPVTTDQEFYAAIVDELHEIRLLLQTIAAANETGGIVCEQCGRPFANDRALRAHMRVHKNGRGS